MDESILNFALILISALLLVHGHQYELTIGPVINDIDN